MTAFTVNSGGVQEWDSFTGGSVNATLDSYAISNKSTLRIAVDTYQCTNHSAAFGSLDTVTFTGTGGEVLVDGTAVRVIPYNTGSGNVPAIGTTISQGGVSGPLLGVWASWLVEPTASGTAMPASGFIKIKSVTGGSFAAGALTGIGASATGPDVTGWIEVRGADTASITVPRTGKFRVTGSWYEIGTTNGTRGQILACPTTATVAGVFPAVWVETSAGSGVYEIYHGVGSMANLATNPTDSMRGKFFWQTTTGIRFGSDGTNNVGFLPPTGCKVRIPNVIFTCCTRTAGSGSGPRVLPNATLATRQEFVTTASGDIQLDKCVMQWYCNFLQAYRADITHSGVNDTAVIQEIASPINLNSVCVAPTQAQLNFALNMVSCFAGGTVSNSVFARFSIATSGSYVNQINFNKGIAFSNNKTVAMLNRGNATTGTVTSTQNIDCTFTGDTLIGGRALHTGVSGVVYTNLHYADVFSGTTGTTNAHYALDVVTGSRGVVLNGIDFGGQTNVHPYNGIISFTNSYDWNVKNIGTTSASLSLGSANASGVIVNGAGNNDNGLIQRVYTANTRTGLWSFLNTDNNITIETVAGDYADTTVIASLNTIAKGVRMTSATTGQTAVYGTHWYDAFTSATVGKIVILCNEPTASSASQCYVTSGTPDFNSVGQVALTVVGQEVTWEMPYFAKGHTALANLAPTLTGTNTGNLAYEFQCDKGTGYNGTWLTLNATNLNAQGAIDPVQGVKLKVRARCTTANAGNLLTNISIPTVTTATAQNEQYPLSNATVNITGLVADSEVRAYVGTDPATAVEVAGTESSSTSFSFTQSVSGQSGYIQVIHLDYQAINFPIVYSSSDVTIPFQQQLDRNYQP